jgi:hypothetical protein
MSLKFIGEAALPMVLAAALAGLGGCGGLDDVQLNGKVFDAIGLNSTAKSAEPKLAARQPLVVPPGLDSLPPPGSGKAEQPSLAEIQDPDAKAKVSQADLEKQQAEYCKVHYEDAKARGDDTTADLATGPLGSCRPSILSAVKVITGSNKPDDDSQ